MPLERYRTIVPDWTRLQETLATPEPVTLRVRTGLVAPETLLRRLRHQGFELAPVQGVDAFWRVTAGPGSVAQTLEHWLGLFHVQQAVMGLPTLALDPRPGERILDLCAAPGGKTAHMAERMGDVGPLVAVEPKEKRIRGLLGNLYRLGHPNVLVVAADGRNLPEGALFDRALVDAPCSAEGNLRRQGGRVGPRDPGFVAHVTEVQEALLRRAIALVRPGGVIVYSTCTFAPEENEGILDRVLADAPVRVEPIRLEAPHAPGLEGWEGRSFRPEVRDAWRVYPHHLDSGGLFMARLRRLPESEGHPAPGLRGAAGAAPDEKAPAGTPDPGQASPPGWTSIPCAFPGEEAAPAETRIERGLHELESLFGFDRARLGALGWLVRGDSIWVQTAHTWPLPAWVAAAPTGRWRLVSAGIRAFRSRGPERETPTNHFLARWSREIPEARRVELEDEELRNLLSDRTIDPSDRDMGPVALFWGGAFLGRGMIGRNGLAAEIPKASAARLRVLLDLGDPAGSGGGAGGPGPR